MFSQKSVAIDILPLLSKRLASLAIQITGTRQEIQELELRAENAASDNDMVAAKSLIAEKVLAEKRYEMLWASQLNIKATRAAIQKALENQSLARTLRCTTDKLKVVIGETPDVDQIVDQLREYVEIVNKNSGTLAEPLVESSIQSDEEIIFPSVVQKSEIKVKLLA